MSQCNYRKIGIVIRNKNIRYDSKSIVPYMCTISQCVLIFLFFVCLFVDFSVSCRMSVKHVAINTLTRRPRFIRDYFFSALFFQMKGFWQSSPFMRPDFVVVAVVVCLFCLFCCAQKKKGKYCPCLDVTILLKSTIFSKTILVTSGPRCSVMRLTSSHNKAQYLFFK